MSEPYDTLRTERNSYFARLRNFSHRVIVHHQSMWRTMMNGKQCRAARAILGITQQELADRSGVSMRSILSFERLDRVLINQNARAVREVLEQAGVEFIDESGVCLR